MASPGLLGAKFGEGGIDPLAPGIGLRCVCVYGEHTSESCKTAELIAIPFKTEQTLAVGGSVAEWLACWTQAQKARVQIAVATLSGNSLRQTVHTHRTSVHQAAKLVAALLRVAGVTAGLVESNSSLPPGL